MPDLSVLIPARNEMFLAQTVKDILTHSEGDTEVIVVLDGAWANPPLEQHPRVRVIYRAQSIGQRAATNEAARLSRAKFVMKCDAHCAFDQGFDVKLMQAYASGEIDEDVTTIPRMYNLHVFDWECRGCQNRTYQGPPPATCAKCNGTAFERVLVWQPRLNRKTDFARFDHTLHFQYWSGYSKRPAAQGDIADVLCFVGASWMMTRERYWQIGGCDEAHGSWGQQGVEMACKSWLSGGRVVVNKRTWFAHLFRTQPGFGFPYPMSGGDQDKARAYSQWMWRLDAPNELPHWDKAVRPLSWLIDHFAPVPDWENQAPKVETISATPSVSPSVSRDSQTNLASAPAKGLLFYTDNRLDESLIGKAVRAQIGRICQARGYELVSASLKPLAFGKNVVVERPRGILTMFKQILAGLEALTAKTVFIVEHDVLYHPSHFDFEPPSDQVFYYNENTWKVRADDGAALFYYCKQTSGLCANRQLLIEHYRKRIALVEQNARELQARGERVKRDGYPMAMGFEPGCHAPPRGVDHFPAERWMSPYANLDIRHDQNLTPNRWEQSQFRDQRHYQGWTWADAVAGWGTIKGRFQELLQGVLYDS